MSHNGIYWSDEETMDCPECWGDGVVQELNGEARCYRCMGSGEVPDDSDEAKFAEAWLGKVK